MAQSSQVGNVQATSDLTGLMHEIFVGRVVNNVAAESVTASLFQDLTPGEYRLEGDALVGAAQLSYAGGAMATGGDLPDHQYKDPVQWQVTPVRRYRRIALDNHVERRASGPGAFEELATLIFDQLWDSWARMEIRQSIGSSNGYIGLCSSRTDADTIVIKDAYGHAGTNPGIMLEVGMVIAWLDAGSSFAAEGAGVINAVTYGDGTVTVSVDTSATWEPGDQIAADDPIVFATTGNISTDYFATEYTLAPNGLGTIVDPDDDLTTVFNISEDTHARWKPFREASASFDHIELTEHWRKLAAKSTSPVNPSSHVCITQGAVVAELARTLEGFQQQTNLGGTFEGGYTGIRVAGMEILQDDYFLHDVLVTLSREDLFRIPLGGDADFFGEDGSMWSRLADFDGKEAFVVDYMNYVSPRRNRHAALTGITLANVNGYDFDAAPNV